MSSPTKHELVDITPDIARKYLEHNDHNRPLRKFWVHELALRMKEGAFETRRDGLLIDECGNLLNGQHRLSAIIESGCVTKMWVTTKNVKQKQGVKYECCMGIL